MSAGTQADARRDIHDRNESVTLSSVKMYCDPVICSKIFDVNGKKVGYLMYDNFDVESVDKLVKLGKDFKSAGVKELIIDLRYNGGGYVLTSTALASMIAPPHVVKEHAVFNKQIYNNNLAQTFDDVTPFVTDTTYQSISGQKVTVHPLEVNPGIGHLWVIVSGESASASEGR